MWLGLAVVILLLWALGGFVFDVAGNLIHLLLILALVAIVLNFVTGRKSV